jgi:hypothetical protein
MHGEEESANECETIAKIEPQEQCVHEKRIGGMENNTREMEPESRETEKLVIEKIGECCERSIKPDPAHALAEKRGNEDLRNRTPASDERIPNDRHFVIPEKRSSECNDIAKQHRKDEEGSVEKHGFFLPKKYPKRM